MPLSADFIQGVCSEGSSKDFEKPWYDEKLYDSWAARNELENRRNEETEMVLWHVKSSAHIPSETSDFLLPSQNYCIRPLFQNLLFIVVFRGGKNVTHSSLGA
jgi:hypothetical protein